MEVDRESFDQILSTFSSSFIEQGQPEHVAKNIVLFYRCLQDINVKVEVQEEHAQRGKICIAIANRRSSKTGFFLNLLKVIQSHGFEIEEARSIYAGSDVFDEKALTHLYVLPAKETRGESANVSLHRLLDALSHGAVV